MIDLNKMDLNELYELNKNVIREINARRREITMEKSAKFKHGDVVYFMSRTGRVEGKILRFMPKNVKIQVNGPSGSAPTVWHVAPIHLNLVTPRDEPHPLETLDATSVSTFIKPAFTDTPKDLSSEVW